MSLFSCKPSRKDLVSDKVKGLGVSVSELGTVEYTIVKVIKLDDEAWFKYGDRKILFSSTAYLKAGIDLQEFNQENVKVNEKTNSVSVTLPKPKLLSFNMPPELIQQEFCTATGWRGDFSPEEKNAIKIQAENDIRADIPNLGILKDAENNAKGFFEVLLRQFGFETIIINFE
jgi:hypothetical protein